MAGVVGNERRAAAAAVALRITAPALADLRGIREYIAEDSPIAAARVAGRLEAACSSLAYMPERGRPGVRLGTRELVSVWPYVIVYRVDKPDVTVLRIFHGAQDRS